jgi:hypothetical protein
MNSLLVIFIILLAILLLISALGGSLNLHEKFQEDEQEQEPVAEMFYEQTEKKPSDMVSPPPLPSQPQVDPSSQNTVEQFTENQGIEPFEDEDMKYGAPL